MEKHFFLGLLLAAAVLAFGHSTYLWTSSKHEPDRRRQFLRGRSNAWLMFGILGLVIAVFGW